MAIEADVTVRLAEVEVTDDYMVALHQRRRHTAYTPDEAEALAKELVDAALQARLVLAEDEAARVTVAHGFDRDPADGLAICRDCKEGKHGACNGSALVRTEDDDVDEVDCECTADGHRGRVVGGRS
jgi:hypothetical protein